jgi:hypothetical protein
MKVRNRAPPGIIRNLPAALWRYLFTVIRPECAMAILPLARLSMCHRAHARSLRTSALPGYFPLHATECRSLHPSISSGSPFAQRNAQSPSERSRTAYLTAAAALARPCVITYLRIKRARARAQERERERERESAAAKSAYNIDVIRH